MAQASQLLPKLSRFAGKLIAGTGVSTKEAVIATAKGGARIAGECCREFVDGLKEGKKSNAAEICAEQVRQIRLRSAGLGDTDGDVERVMDARKVG